MPSLETTTPADKPPRQRRARVDVEAAVYDIARFCDSHNVSRTKLYKLWREGRGPKFFKLGKSLRITAEAAAEWRAAMQAETDALIALTESENPET
jgi:hypothetical protein